MDRIDLLKAIRTWQLEHKRDSKLKEALVIVTMLQDIGLIKFVNNIVCCNIVADK